MTPRRLAAFALVAVAALQAPRAPAQPVPAPGPLSPRNASYTIEVRLDSEAKGLEGRQVLTWRNVRAAPADELRFHLYWNAWRNSRSTWMLEERLTGDLPKKIPEDAWGWIEVDSIRLLGPSGGPGRESAEPGGAAASAAGSLDLSGEARFDSPDDGNPDDRTVLVVPLPAPVAPGETVEVEMAWRARVPRTFARTGFRGDFFFLAHWFPAVGVFEGEAGWSCHQFHSNTEFYADYGVYDVTIRTPERFVVGATGRQVEERPAAPGDSGGREIARRFVQEDVHGFTWTASPDYRVATGRFEAPGLPPVDLRLLYQPEHAGQVERHLAATKAALELYGAWFGPYAYDHLTVVDPAWESGAGGMEYPTLFTAGTRLFSAPAGLALESVTIHEAGHQLWYGMVGNDEQEHAWLDEGLNTYSHERALAERYGDEALVVRYLRPPGTGWRGFLPVVQPEAATGLWTDRRNRYRRSATRDVPAVPSYRYYPASHGDITYSKTTLWLATLERHLGWETVREILATFLARWSFRHPEPEDLFAVANEVAGERRGVDLDGFFDQVHYGDASFDYAVERADSFEAAVEGLVGEGGELVYWGRGEGRRVEEEETAEGGGAAEEVPTLYRSEVVVRRLGEGVFPVEVAMVFEDGSELRRLWDGRYRWRLFVHEGPSKLDYAMVDPDRILLLDLDRTNDSREVEDPGWLVPAKWAAKWLIWAQDLLQTWTFYV
ncbi:MAG TPA: M1 family metallopeptidase [Thermoanaerobaculia bacterium]|nr:M1 family metallopeptidase [Thermoanaerobaculia bacterium]